VGRIEVRCIQACDLERALAAELARLSRQIWPGDPDSLVQTFLQPPADPPDLPAPRGRIFHVIHQERQAAAMGISFGRRIMTAAGPMTVLALAGVCTRPERRGQGFGGAIVRSAFDRVDRGDFPLSLYQTTPPVRAFYQKLGARVVDNLVINSLKDPHKRAFWDEVVMIYPATAPWPAGAIDLLGPGY
jgi:GNAT superfamily N-acetyltransferase